jgi:transposase
MYPNRQQEAQLELTLDTCRYLYDQALADRKKAYETEGISRSYEDQAAMLVAEKRDGNFKVVFSQVLQDVLRRLDKSFKAFFRRVKAGKMVELVDARYTSQKCSQRGIVVPKTLAERVHRCPNCGLEMDRDINASLNILTLGLRGRAYQDPTPTLSKRFKAS